MKLIELMVFRGGRRDFFFRAGATRATRGKQESQRPGFVLPGANREIPGMARGCLGAGRNAGQILRDGLPGAPSDTSEGPGRPRDGTPGYVCLDTTPSSDRFGTERQAKPAGRIKGDFRAHLRIQVRAPAGRPRDGTPSKSCGTDQRRLPGASPDTSKDPRQASGCEVGIPTLPIGPKSAPVCPQSA